MLYNCDKCTKTYFSSSALCRHKRLKHFTETDSKVCKFCVKEFTRKFNLERHLVTCKKNPNNFGRLEKYNEEKKKLKLQKLEDQITNNINRFMNDGLKEVEQYNLSPVLVKSIQNIIKNQNNNSSLVNSQNDIKNTIIVNIGSENLSNILSETEQLKILRQRTDCLKYLIRYIHCGEKYPQFHNTLITDIKSNRALIYDDTLGDYKMTRRDKAIDDIIECRLEDIEDFMENNNTKIKEMTKKSVTNYLTKIVNESENPKSQTIKQLKTDIALDIYNAKNIITKTKKQLKLKTKF